MEMLSSAAEQREALGGDITCDTGRPEEEELLSRGPAQPRPPALPKMRICFCSPGSEAPHVRSTSCFREEKGRSEGLWLTALRKGGLDTSQIRSLAESFPEDSDTRSSPPRLVDGQTRGAEGRQDLLSAHPPRGGGEADAHLAHGHLGRLSSFSTCPFVGQGQWPPCVSSRWGVCPPTP